MRTYKLQPIIITKDNTLLYNEFLTRLYDDKGKPLSIESIIKDLESTGEIVNFDLFTIKTALRVAAMSSTPIGVNLSTKTLGSSQLISLLESAKKEEPELFLKTKLFFEITEYSDIFSVETVSENLSKLRMLGIKFAADDFGNGNMDIEMIRFLKPDYVKVRLNDMPDHYEQLSELAEEMHFSLIIENISDHDAFETALTYKHFALQGWYLD